MTLIYMANNNCRQYKVYCIVYWQKDLCILQCSLLLVRGLQKQKHNNQLPWEEHWI